jgi:hypothetical protein
MSDLLERLRKMAEADYYGHDQPHFVSPEECADEIERLQKRVDELETALTSALGGWEAAPPEEQDDYVDIEALRRVAKHRSGDTT